MILSVWSFLKSNFNALLLVCAVMGIVTVATSAYRMGKQTEAIGHLTEANKLWAEAFRYQREANALEQANVKALQTKLDVLHSQSNERAAALKELERTNAEVKAMLDTRLPDELVSLLDRQNAKRN